MSSAWLQYRTQRKGAGRRGIPFLLSFEEWAALWVQSGKWHQRGSHFGQFCMARYGDTGPYALGNVRICSVEENQAEWFADKSRFSGENASGYGRNPWAVMSGEVRERRRNEISQQFSKPKTEAHKAKLNWLYVKSETHRAAIGAAFKGRKASEETRAKMALAARQRWARQRGG